jgi:lysophospholipase L1-like esterase
MTQAFLDPRRTIVFAGDSVTDCGRRTDPASLGDGYVKSLYDAFGADRPRIVNAGISGHRAVDLAARWQPDVLDHEPDLISVLIGINDTWRRYDKDDPTSVESFERSYRAMLDGVQAQLVLVEPFLLAVKEEQHAWREDLDPKIEVVRRLAAEYGALLVPADVEFNRQTESVGATTLADDGVHPTAAGHELLADLWRRTVLASGLSAPPVLPN